MATESLQIRISQVGGVLLVENPYDYDENSFLHERFNQVLPLLRLLVEADYEESRLSDSEHKNRFAAISASNLIASASIYRATNDADNYRMVVAGVLTATDCGFPEFEGEKEGNV